MRWSNGPSGTTCQPRSVFEIGAVIGLAHVVLIAGPAGQARWDRTDPLSLRLLPRPGIAAGLKNALVDSDRGASIVFSRARPTIS
jgi:hypothetical protein